MPHSSIVEWLAGGDRRQFGASDAVTSEVIRHNERFEELFDAMLCDDAVVRMRAAIATDNVTRVRPDLLVPLRKRLIAEVGEVEQDDVRRHVAQMLPRLKLEPKERSKAIALLERYLTDVNPIVIGLAMQALADFAADDGALRKRLTPIINRLGASGTAEVQARAKKVLAKFELAQHGGMTRPQPRR